MSTSSYTSRQRIGSYSADTISTLDDERFVCFPDVVTGTSRQITISALLDSQQTGITTPDFNIHAFPHRARLQPLRTPTTMRTAAPQFDESSSQKIHLLRDHTYFKNFFSTPDVTCHIINTKQDQKSSTTDRKKRLSLLRAKSRIKLNKISNYDESLGDGNLEGIISVKTVKTVESGEEVVDGKVRQMSPVATCEAVEIDETKITSLSDYKHSDRLNSDGRTCKRTNARHSKRVLFTTPIQDSLHRHEISFTDSAPPRLQYMHGIVRNHRSNLAEQMELTGKPVRFQSDNSDVSSETIGLETYQSSLPTTSSATSGRRSQSRNEEETIRNIIFRKKKALEHSQMLKVDISQIKPLRRPTFIDGVVKIPVWQRDDTKTMPDRPELIKPDVSSIRLVNPSNQDKNNANETQVEGTAKWNNSVHHKKEFNQLKLEKKQDSFDQYNIVDDNDADLNRKVDCVLNRQGSSSYDQICQSYKKSVRISEEEPTSYLYDRQKSMYDQKVYSNHQHSKFARNPGSPLIRQIYDEDTKSRYLNVKITSRYSND